MVAKSRGIRLKKHLDQDDRSQQTLLHVAYLEEALSERRTGDDGAVAVAPPPPRPAEQPLRTHPSRDDRQVILRARRRAVARILREGLEDTLALLDEALENTRT